MDYIQKFEEHFFQKILMSEKIFNQYILSILHGLETITVTSATFQRLLEVQLALSYSCYNPLGKDTEQIGCKL
jgi:DNA helicase IV